MTKIRAGFLLLLFYSATSYATTIVVSSGDNLANKINGASGGDTVLVNNGTYGAFTLYNRKFTQALPLIIKAAPGAKPVIKNTWYQAPMSNSCYIVLDGLTFDSGGQPIYCTSVSNIILVNLEVRNTSGEAVHIRGTSRYVDIINCHIHNTGGTQPQYSEGIYIGSGSTPFMNEENIWIEANNIHNTANSEGINVKPQSYHITMRYNKVHDMQPGTTNQYNEAGLSLESADLTFKPHVDTDIWIENNEIYNLTFGQYPNGIFANGIQATDMGGRIKCNYIHDCAGWGIYFNTYGYDGKGYFTNVLYNNQIVNCSYGSMSSPGTLPVVTRDPGANPNGPQTWYISNRDTDGDGMTDVDEARAGTDPNNPASLLAFYPPSTNFVLSSGFVVQWQSATNRWYNLWASTNLLAGFSQIASHIPATPPMNTYTSVVEQAASAYYRISLDP